MRDIIAKINSKVYEDRDLAASDAADWFEAKTLSKADYTELVECLLAASLKETNSVVRESIFNALSYAADSEWVGEFDWQKIVTQMPRLDRQCLEYCLEILGSTGEPQYDEIISSYLSSDDSVLREAAGYAIQENTYRFSSKQQSPDRS